MQFCLVIWSSTVYKGKFWLVIWSCTREKTENPQRVVELDLSLSTHLELNLSHHTHFYPQNADFIGLESLLSRAFQIYDHMFALTMTQLNATKKLELDKKARITIQPKTHTFNWHYNVSRTKKIVLKLKCIMISGSCVLNGNTLYDKCVLIFFGGYHKSCY